ncbi:hypothetical protein H7E67_01340 [Clostridium gasigenes]|uniref:hypothetical protein n=1 Tax=Clostridium gasigenes TaxID=94869 RepID=UPI00162323DF|nr:hypothetical protein [Clostridium gasigenes]MBB6622063.1 hypothetical protein [Clostridium gasigenes]
MLLIKMAELKGKVTKEQFADILDETTRDIKFNRIGFHKRTSQKEFGDILDIVAHVVLSV